MMKDGEVSSATKVERNFLTKVFYLYYDGFRNMTVGKTLWVIIGIKLVIFFLILRWIFFPDFLSGKGANDQEKAAYVKEQLTKPR